MLRSNRYFFEDPSDSYLIADIAIYSVGVLAFMLYYISDLFHPKPKVGQLYQARCMCEEKTELCSYCSKVKNHNKVMILLDFKRDGFNNFPSVYRYTFRYINGSPKDITLFIEAKANFFRGWKHIK